MSFGTWWHDLPLPLKILGIGGLAAGGWAAAPAVGGALGMGGASGAAGAAGAGTAAGGVGPLALGGTTGFGATAVPGLATGFQAMGGAPMLAGQYAASSPSMGFLGSLGAFAGRHPQLTAYGKDMGMDALNSMLQGRQKGMMQPSYSPNVPGQWKAYAGRDTLGELMAQMREQYNRPMWTTRDQT